MRLRETLTNRQKIDLFNGQVVGIFPTMVLQEDAYYSKLKELCLGYYTARSAEKTISPTYENIINFVNENPEVNETADEIMGRLIRGKFLEKWTRVYEVLVSEQYNALHNMEITEHKDATNKDTDTHNTVKGKQGTNSDTTTFDTSVEDNGKTGTSETITRTVDGADGVYGFNSQLPVGDSTNVENTSETTVGDADKNTTYNLRTKSGTETKQFGVDETETHTGTDTTDTIINENISKSGRDGSGAELIEKELNLRNTQIFFDIIYADIDSMTTLQIYI